MYLHYLDTHIQTGTLHLHLPDGTRYTFGQNGPEVDWFLHSAGTLKRILRNPPRMLGETYLRGEWRVNDGHLRPFLSLLLRNIAIPSQRPLIEHGYRLFESLRKLTGRAATATDPDRFSPSLLRLFLDSDLHCGSGYFPEPDISLEEAQRAKCRHLMRKLCLKPGQQVLDLNAGWGGTALYLAEHCDVQVTALVRNQQQLHYVQETARQRGIPSRLNVLRRDYRKHSGKYDGIIAQGLAEQHNPGQYPALFHQLNQLLQGNGILVLQSVGHTGTTCPTNPWLKRHLLPHHYHPSLSELSRGAETGGLVACDIEILQTHFAHTLAAWQRRFQHNRPAIAHLMGDRFCRLWEFYLAACEAGFLWGDLTEFELQLSRHKRITPDTRDYQYPGGEQPAPEAQEILADLARHGFRTERD